ncbi:MAG: hypothetical protein ACI81A_002774 [Paraglaciecola sp.]
MVKIHTQLFISIDKLKHIIILLCLIFSCSALAEDDLWEITLDGLQTAFPEQSQLKFKQNYIKFDGCHQRDYQFLLNQRVSKNWHIETALVYEKSQLTLGAHKQKVSIGEWSLIPRYQLNSRLNIGFGVVRQMAVQFETANNADMQLPKSTRWVVSSRTPGLKKDHYLDVTLSSRQWQRTNITGNGFERGQGDKKVSISYTGNF